MLRSAATPDRTCATEPAMKNTTIRRHSPMPEAPAARGTIRIPARNTTPNASGVRLFRA